MVARSRWKTARILQLWTQAKRAMRQVSWRHAGTGSTITGCTNEGKISGAGDYVGGILATGTGTTVISRCINSGEIISTGKPGSYNYSVGGIAGSLSSSTVELCGNTGTVTSTLKRTAGIVGSFGGTMTKCFNSGSITGIYASGGIVGGICCGERQRDRLLQYGQHSGATRRRLRTKIPMRRASAVLSAIRNRYKQYGLQNQELLQRRYDHEYRYSDD